MAIHLIITLLSAFGSFVSSILAIAAIFVKVPIFFLRAAGAIKDTAELQFAKRQDRISRILLIARIEGSEICACRVETHRRL